MTGWTPQGERPAREALGRSLIATGAMAAEWMSAFEAVDRATFLPARIWPHDMLTRTASTVDRSEDPVSWYRYVDDDVPITTQWDDGRHAGPGPGNVPTSSCSAPSVVFAMLGDLRVGSGMRVLEIGTGTGYTAALLSHRIGDSNVTTVEIDAGVAAGAREALLSVGLRPNVVVGDGVQGHEADAPFDRLIATCGMRSIPAAWLRQTVPGGLIVAPWGTEYSNRDYVVRLTKRADGSAAGGFVRPVEFMKARSQRSVRAAHAEYLPDGFPGDASSSTTRLPGEAFERFGPAEFAVGLRVRDCALVTDRRGDRQSVWLYGLTDRSWAAGVLQDGGGKATVFQSGGRRLWDEVAEAYDWWRGHGEPGPERFGLTVTADGQQHAWLDAPTDCWAV
ncbi:methyltransferase domain-containing protein [Allostreptomyces psammosilenae]|uniref:Protein-L-isoaspartate O-methyltransferase n=1 Tax=Allostreptomyces psammosilenae TaxID=1892865 RepID=A0A853A4P0_9ACTN|nr:methyltransferase domain-containing protein [Allostreptomyces psammosilenae]NYI07844.1 protein-L-isoaspartate O-methyltransferase [Allostreptomyces psammosilenae]